jgi:hypothetical protein
MRSGGRRQVGIVLLGFAAGVLLAGSAFFARRAYVRNEQFKQWFLDRPCDLAVDLSRPGVTWAPFVQTCAVAHGELLFLKLDAGEGEGGVPARKPGERLRGLAGHVAIADGQGREVLREPLGASSARPGYAAEEIILLSVDPFPTGRYTISFEVEAGAASLAGVPQRAHAGYLLCGTEAIPVLRDLVWTALAGLSGLVLAVVLAVVVVRGRRPAGGEPADPAP